jgi:hypothetical protein
MRSPTAPLIDPRPGDELILEGESGTLWKVFVRAFWNGRVYWVDRGAVESMTIAEWRERMGDAEVLHVA